MKLKGLSGLFLRLYHRQAVLWIGNFSECKTWKKVNSVKFYIINRRIYG